MRGKNIPGLASSRYVLRGSQELRPWHPTTDCPLPCLRAPPTAPGPHLRNAAMSSPLAAAHTTSRALRSYAAPRSNHWRSCTHAPCDCVCVCVCVCVHTCQHVSVQGLCMNASKRACMRAPACT